MIIPVGELLAEIEYWQTELPNLTEKEKDIALGYIDDLNYKIDVQ